MMEGRMDGGWREGLMDGKIHEWKDGQMDGRKDDGCFGLSFFTAFLVPRVPEYPNSIVIVWQNPFWNFSQSNQLKGGHTHLLLRPFTPFK